MTDEIHNRLERMEGKLDTLAEKLDGYAETTAKHGADLVWVKGAVKVGGSMLVAVLGFLAQAFFGAHS